MNILKKLLITAALLASVPLSQSAFAEGPISANVALTSNYIFRGVTQNNEDPALQGGFDYEHKSGFYTGVWGSNVDFGGDESTEIDIYGGWGFDVGGGVSLDFGVILYRFFGGDTASNSDIEEAYAGVSLYGFDLYYYSGLDDATDNVELSYGFDLTEGLGLGFTIGDYEDVSDEYYSVSLSGTGPVSLWGVDWDITIADADATDDVQGALTISKSF